MGADDADPSNGQSEGAAGTDVPKSETADPQVTEPAEVQKSDEKAGGESEGSDDDAAPETHQAETGAPALSKSAQKRLAKQVRIQEMRVAKKQAKKDAKAAARKAVAAEGDGSETPAKKQRTGVETGDGEPKVGRNQKEREEFDLQRLAGYRVVIDLSFDDSMSEKEAKSLVVQIAHSYGTNRRSPKPLNLHLTSVGKRVGDGLKKISGFDNWRCVCEERHYVDVFPKSEIVYLTSDSENTLETLESGKVYCIGGIVDHNRLKGLTHSKATELGLATAKLPIEGNADLGENRRVLTVNHVFAALVHYSESGSWKDAFLKALPSRKLRDNAAAAGGAGGGDDDEGEEAGAA